MNASDVYVVLRNRQPIAYAYAFERDDAANLLHFSELPKPTLQVTSYTLWDKEISRMATLIRSGALKPLSLSFGWPNKLIVDSSDLSAFRNPDILIAQSYDQNWVVSNIDDVQIDPTNLRFMHLTLPAGTQAAEINLENHWPWWHWPVQSLGIMMVVLTVIGSLITGWLQRKSIVSSR